MRSLRIVQSVAMLAAALLTTVASADTYVLVHGVWGGGWSFAGLAAELEAAGHRVYRPSLTGLGAREHLASTEIDLDTHTQDIVNLLRFEDLHDVILVGHSYGGMVITQVADREPGRLRRRVYLDAFLPETGESMWSLLLPQRREQAEKLVRDGFLVPPPSAGSDRTPGNRPIAMAALRQPARLGDDTGAGVPGTYVLTVDAAAAAEDDPFFRFAERARARGWPVTVLVGGHNVHRSEPSRVAKALLAGGGE